MPANKIYYKVCRRVDCDNSFKTPTKIRIYCSDTCRDTVRTRTYYYKRREKERQIKKCLCGCGESLVGRSRQTIYHTKKCMYRAKRTIEQSDEWMIKKLCRLESCEREFHNGNPLVKYCCEICRQTARTERSRYRANMLKMQRWEDRRKQKHICAREGCDKVLTVNSLMVRGGRKFCGEYCKQMVHNGIAKLKRRKSKLGKQCEYRHCEKYIDPKRPRYTRYCNDKCWAKEQWQKELDARKGGISREETPLSVIYS